MKSLILLCTLFQAIYIGMADETFNYNHQNGRIISVLMKKIRDLEVRNREFDRELEEIDVLKELLDEAHRRLENMQKLEHRLEKAEERIWMLINRVDNNKVNKPATMKVVDTNGTAVSNTESRQTEMGKKIVELVPIKNRIQTSLKLTATINRKRTVTRKAAFTAMFSSTPVSITPGRSLQFDRVDYNEGNAYDARTGIFTCPVSGTYFFFTNIVSMYHAGSIVTEIVFEGQGKGGAHANKEENHAQGSTAASLHCNAGQRVWIQAVYGSQSWGDMFSSFTGVLMWEDAAATNSN